MTDEAKLAPVQILAKWIIDNVTGHIPKDHACHECVPGGDLVVAGFQCGFHMAVAYAVSAGPAHLDVYGIDDHGVYFPPSRRRYEAMKKQFHDLEARVDELQAACTSVENARRMWNARATAASALLRASLVELPVVALVARTCPDEGVVKGELAKAYAMIGEVAERADELERDAWTGASMVARGFIEEAEGVLRDYSAASDSLRELLIHIEKWRARFARALDVA